VNTEVLCRYLLVFLFDVNPTVFTSCGFIMAAVAAINH